MYTFVCILCKKKKGGKNTVDIQNLKNLYKDRHKCSELIVFMTHADSKLSHSVRPMLGANIRPMSYSSLCQYCNTRTDKSWPTIDRVVMNSTPFPMLGQN